MVFTEEAPKLEADFRCTTFLLACDHPSRNGVGGGATEQGHVKNSHGDALDYTGVAIIAIRHPLGSIWRTSKGAYPFTALVLSLIVCSL